MPTDHLPWQQKLAAAKQGRADFWSFDAPDARVLVGGMLSEVAERLGGGRVVENADAQNVELHAELGGARFRVEVWMSYGSFRNVNTFGTEDLADLWLERGSGEDGFVSLAEGLWLKPYEDAERELATWRGLLGSARETIVREMARLDVWALNTDRRWVSLNATPGLEDLEDPVAYILSAAKLLALVGEAVPRAGG